MGEFLASHHTDAELGKSLDGFNAENSGFIAHRPETEVHLQWPMTPAVFESTSWPDGIIQLLDDHHVVVLCDDASTRRRVGRSVGEHLGSLADTRVIHIDCTDAADLPAFCRQLEPYFPDRPASPAPWWRNVSSVIDVLRSSGSGSTNVIVAGGSGLKREYFLWHEAEALLEADVRMFSALVNAFLGVAAEREHVSADRLVLQRVVFLGGAKLGAYAEDPNGQFTRWLEEDDSSPFWEVLSVVERPPVITFRVDG